MHKRVAIVTGGSRGIGEAISLALADAGVRVAVNYRSDVERAKEVCARIEEFAGEAISIQADVSQTVEVEALFAETEEAFGEVSILVNNAGITADSLVLRMSDDSWSNVIGTNLFGPFSCSRRALVPMLRSRWGRIINIASVVGVNGNPGQGNYAASKAGLIGFTRTLAKEVGGKGVTVNAIAPGLVQTDLTAGISSVDALLARVPAGRVGTSAEVGSLVAFLASDQAGYINGAVVTVDGGMTA